jgi:PP-loop superfamily ATP-utilizing enzyme
VCTLSRWPVRTSVRAGAVCAVAWSGGLQSTAAATMVSAKGKQVHLQNLFAISMADPLIENMEVFTRV